MDPDLTLYDNPDSTNALKVRILLAELGQEARSIAVPLEGERRAEYLDLHPFGLIPTLVDADLVVTESNTALRYLAERAGRWDLRGSDPRERARVDVVLDSLSLEVRPHLWAVEEFAHYGLDVSEDDRAARRAGLDRALDGFERLLDPGGPYALGSTLTIADCAIAGRFLHIGELSLVAIATPRLHRVVGSMRRRASYARAASTIRGSRTSGRPRGSPCPPPDGS